jgi:hypothetical protein
MNSYEKHEIKKIVVPFLDIFITIFIILKAMKNYENCLKYSAATTT